MRAARRPQSTTSTKQPTRARKNTGSVPVITLATLSNRELAALADGVIAETERRLGTVAS